MADVTSDEIRRHIDAVRSALNVLDASPGAANHPSEGLRDLAQAVDNLRSSIWAVLEGEHAGDYDGFLARVRVSRATGLFEEVLSDLYAGTLTPVAPGIEVFRTALRELKSAWAGGAQ